MPDLHDLEALVRAARPVPDPGWASRLDARAAARFAAPRRARTVRPRRWNLLAAAGSLAGVLLVVAIGVAGLTGGSRNTSDSGESGSSASGTRMARPLSGSGEKSAGGGGSSATAPAPATRLAQDRSVQRSASITLSTRPAGVEQAADSVIQVADALGGFVQSSSVRSGSGAGAEILLRVPQEKLQKALSQLSRIAHVRRRSQEAEDVTDQRSVLLARVRDARADRDGLRRRLARATTDKEASHLRALLDRAERRVTRRERAVAALDRTVSLATIDVSVVGDARGQAAPPAGRWTPRDALRDAGRVLEVALGVVVVGAAALLPLALFAALAAVAGRLFVRRRRERALEMAA